MASSQPITPVVGNVVRITAPFLTAGLPVVPAGPVTFYAVNPVTGTATAYVYGTDSQVIADGAATYHVDWPVPNPGEWRFRAASGPGAGEAAGEVTVTVVASIVL